MRMLVPREWTRLTRQSFQQSAGSVTDRNGAPDPKDVSSVVKRRHGLTRCRYKGFVGMNRWIGAIVFDRLASRQIDYIAPSGRSVTVEFPCIPHLGLWSKPGAGFICIEPWQGYASPVDFAGELSKRACSRLPRVRRQNSQRDSAAHNLSGRF